MTEADWREEQQHFLAMLADRFSFLAEFPDLAPLAEIEERALRRRAQEVLDEWQRERREERDAKFYLLGFRAGLAIARRSE